MDKHFTRSFILCPIIKFNWGAGNAQSMIDNVNYADITQTQDTPEVEKTC